ncbi:MAG: sulfotransferase family 2 domain-containing protein [Rhodobacteraceae bacterium]|nr:sulfotransferase family 2 domain-containing protein [Paracoccaceae bacterium]
MTQFSGRITTLDSRLQGAARAVGLQRAYFDLREYARARLIDNVDLAENRKHRAIFVHVPKCAGTAIATQLPIAHGHRSAEFLRWKDPVLFDACFTFGFVRNPYDRFVSAFHYLRSDKTSARDAAWGRQFLGQYADFRDFAQAMLSPVRRGPVLGWLHFLPQTYFLCDRQNRVLVDFVGRQESFSEDLATVNERSGLALANQRARTVARDDYRSYYSAETAHLVERIYADDFALFGYSKDPLLGSDGR